MFYSALRCLDAFVYVSTDVLAVSFDLFWIAFSSRWAYYFWHALTCSWMIFQMCSILGLWVFDILSEVWFSCDNAYELYDNYECAIYIYLSINNAIRIIVYRWCQGQVVFVTCWECQVVSSETYAWSVSTNASIISSFRMTRSSVNNHSLLCLWETI